METGYWNIGMADLCSSSPSSAYIQMASDILQNFSCRDSTNFGDLKLFIIQHKAFRFVRPDKAGVSLTDKKFNDAGIP